MITMMIMMIPMMILMMIGVMIVDGISTLPQYEDDVEVLSWVFIDCSEREP